jgi:hypothetical protein
MELDNRPPVTKLSFGLAPREMAKSRLRQRLSEMTDEEFASVRQDIGEAVQDTFKKIEQKVDMSVFELAACEFAERVKNGQSSMDVIRDFVDRIPNEWGRSELIRHLKVHLPDEPWKAEPTIYKKQCMDSAFMVATWEEQEKAEKRQQELKAKIEAGTATYSDRLEELVLTAEIGAVSISGFDPVGQHLRQQEIEGVMWVLNLLLRPIMPRGKAMVPMKPHEAAAVRSGNWSHRAEEVSRPGGLGALLDVMPFN